MLKKGAFNIPDLLSVSRLIGVPILFVLIHLAILIGFWSFIFLYTVAFIESIAIF